MYSLTLSQGRSDPIGILHIRPELGIKDYRFQYRKGVGPLKREHRGSRGSAKEARRKDPALLPTVQ